MDDIELLNEAIRIISNGNQDDFCRKVHLKSSTAKNWRTLKKVPDDKKILLQFIMDNHILKDKLRKATNYINAKQEFEKSFIS